ncbi:MAG TPA: hypothetical protein VG713_14330, partial [Pirellulales bacterium]|nr:hypothetical protein [Pirellulales bacterium]
ERQVVRDASGDYVNQGSWTMFDEQGREMGHGKYSNGLRQGQWERRFAADEAEMLGGKWGRMFEAPFYSTVTFVDDQMHGVWKTFDAGDRPVAAWTYENGQRHGKSVWYFPNGRLWREANYDHGELHGNFEEWASDGSPVSCEPYVQGRREDVKVEWLAPGVKKVEAHYLFAKEIVRIEDDFWEGTHRTVITDYEGDDVRHGLWTEYHANGQKAMQGSYVDNVATGPFVWWHPNGQRAIEGEYDMGHQSGRWTWWYETGRRRIQGAYDQGHQSGEWTWWSREGEITENALYGDMIADVASTEGAIVMPADLLPGQLAGPIATPSTHQGKPPIDPAQLVTPAPPPKPAVRRVRWTGPRR